jgi:pilus assembly protein Flp/PilA
MVRLYSHASTWWFDLRNRATDDSGATAVEYALMVALIALVVIGAVTILGENTSSKFDTVGTAVGAS